MTGLAIAAAVAVAAVLGSVGWVLRGARDLIRLQRELTGWQLNEAMRKVSGQDMEALVHATREPELWAAGCGCRWEMSPAAWADPLWVPCDKHADRLLRAVHEDGEL
jgi:hypothetical protein